ncbi:MAG: ABC transporter substrate-binding protein [Gaiellaceae bacterium]
MLAKGRLALITVALVALVAGCGKSNGKSGAGTSTSLSSISKAAGEVKHEPFPLLKMEMAPTLDYLDPGLSYTIEAWQTMWNVYLTLVGYPHVNGPAGAQLVPVLATGLPEVSADGRVYRMTLRQGLRFSNGQPVKASDFVYAIRRLYLLRSPGAILFDNIVGATPAAARRGSIPGLRADNATGSITIRLRKPQGDFSNLLATPFAAPVPAGTPMRYQASKPVPSTGPYAISEVRPFSGFTLVRNRFFVPTDSVPATNPDRVEVTLDADPEVALQRVLSGQVDVSLDEPLSPKDVQDVQSTNASHLRVYTPANTYYVFMNTRTPPFNDVRVRRAVNYAIDRSHVAALYGGLAVPTQNVLPPVYPSYRKLSLYTYDINRARALVRRAHAVGQSVTVYGVNRPTAIKVVNYLQGQLKAIGLRSKVAILNEQSYYPTLAKPKTHAQIGLADRYQAYPNPLDWLQALFYSPAVPWRPTANYSFARIPKLNSLIGRMSRQSLLGPKQDAAWAAADRLAVKDALVAPLVNRRYVHVFSRQVDLGCYVNSIVYELDFGRLCRSG